MSTIGIRVLLFLSSYFPLALIFFLLYLKKNACFAYTALGTGCVGLVGLAAYLYTASRLSPVPVKVTSVQRRDAEAMSYIVTYVIPFLALPADDRDKGIALAIFFITIAIIYVNSEMIHINPMLNAVGFHLYEISSGERSDCYLISRIRMPLGEIVNVVSLTDDIYFQKTR